MSEILIAELATEGGGAMICGKQINNQWVFWYKGDSICLDENADEDWRYWTSNEVDDLRAALPKEWIMFYPISIHQGFLVWFQKAYEEELKTLPADRRKTHENFMAQYWRTILYRQEE